jgi:hypothetical protein
MKKHVLSKIGRVFFIFKYDYKKNNNKNLPIILVNSYKIYEQNRKEGFNEKTLGR